MMVGISVVEGAGQAGSGVGQGVTQLATGSLILLMGGFAPWVAIKMFHFTGDALAGAHAYAAQAPTGAQTVIAAPAKMHALHSHASTALSRNSAAGGQAARPDAGQSTDATTGTGGQARDSSEAIYDKANQRATADTSADATAGQSPSTEAGRSAVAADAGAENIAASSGPTEAAASGHATSAGPAAAGGAAGGTGAATSGGAAGGAAGVGAVAAPAAVAGAAHQAGTAAGRASQNAATDVAPERSTGSQRPAPATSQAPGSEREPEAPAQRPTRPT
jgi:hypothetical protein